MKPGWANATDATQEITISRAQGKDSSDYESLMAQAFVEIRRVLRRGARLQSCSIPHWPESGTRWHRAYTDADLSLEMASVLDKNTGKFQAGHHCRRRKGDPILLLGKNFVEAQARSETRDVRCEGTCCSGPYLSGSSGANRPAVVFALRDSVPLPRNRMSRWMPTSFID